MHSAHETAGAARTRSSLRPLLWGGANLQNSGAVRSRERDVVFVARMSAAICGSRISLRSSGLLAANTVRRVGKAKRAHQLRAQQRMVDTAQVRLCPPYENFRESAVTNPARAPGWHCRRRSGPGSTRPCPARPRYGRPDYIRPCRTDSRCPSRCGRARTRRSGTPAGDS